ncbi:protein of unknown function [Methylocaldum szegediense]|uniref:HEPN domain-containing protein n=1 Tax=Methylocaldum szegediense TaxID=73780 RepID=A0ABM9HX35_9GAMM|nr:protein of unknown function [Methylocaldum szegediense]
MIEKLILADRNFSLSRAAYSIHYRYYFCRSMDIAIQFSENNEKISYLFFLYRVATPAVPA